MFKASLTGDGLDSILDPVQAIVDESKFHLEDDELATTAVDPANVAMIDYSLNPAALDAYEGDGRVIGVNLDRLSDVGGMASKDDAVDLELPDDSSKMRITVAHQLDYTLALLDPDSIRDEPDLPDIDYPARITLTGSQLSRGVKAADMVSDHVALSVNADDNEFVVKAEGDTDDVDLTLDEESLVDIDADEDATSLFSLDYLKDMESAIPGDTEILIELGDELPVKLHFDLFDGEAQVTYMLAPRIETE